MTDVAPGPLVEEWFNSTHGRKKVCYRVENYFHIVKKYKAQTIVIRVWHCYYFFRGYFQ